MINSFKDIGTQVLKNSGYNDTENVDEKRKLYLNFQTLVPYKKECKEKDKKGQIKFNYPANILVLDFDLENKTFDFVLGEELDIENRESIFAFSVGAPGDRKKFLSTSVMMPDLSKKSRFYNKIIKKSRFYNKIIPESVSYIEAKRTDKISEKWFSENVSEDYDNLLKKIRDTFYIKVDEKTYILNREYLVDEKKDSLLNIEKIILEKKNDGTEHVFSDTLYDALILEEFNISTYPSINMIKINGKHILSYDEYKKSYINIVYYDLLERFFIEKTKANKICHMCGESKNVTGDVPLPMKFYGVSNNLYLENIKSSNSYKSFSICKDCLIKIKTGMNFVSNNLKSYLLDNNCYLIPEIDKNESSFYRKYKGFLNILKSTKGYTDDISIINKLLKESNKKNFKFNLLFFDSPPGSQVFNIIKNIQDLNYKNTSEKLEMFDRFNEEYNLSLIGDKGSNINLYNIRNYFFPTKYSHVKVDISLFRKDIINLLEDFFQGNSIDYNKLIQRFMHIYRLRFNRNAVDALSPFKMILLLTIFNNIKPLKGLKTMKEESITQVKNEEYQNFFNRHQEIYSDRHKQGLFLLGTLIDKIVGAQKSKNKDIKPSSTFLKKLNFNGILPHKVSDLIAEVEKFAMIYNIYEERSLKGSLMDRLQGIEDSKMNGKEVIFYILTGKSFSDYLCFNYVSTHKIES